MVATNALFSVANAWRATWPILIAILSFLVMIFIHEFGHFIFAKLLGVRVNEFAIGFGPKLFRKQGKETLYTVRALPFGGYNAMEGEDEDSDDPKAFCNKRPWRRFLIVAAGASFNILFCFILVSCMLLPQDRYPTTTVAAFADGAVSEQSGLQVEDTIYSVNGRRILTTTDLSYTFTNIPADGKVDMTVLRDGEKVHLSQVQFSTASQDGVNYVQVDFSIYGRKRTVLSWMEQSVKATLSYGRVVWWSLLDLITGKYGISQMSGPVGVTVAIGDMVKSGVLDYLNIIALISINLGIFNLLPVPALDGGRLFFILVEMIFRRPIPKKYEAIVHAAGFILLMLFMAFVTVKDIFGLFR